MFDIRIHLLLFEVVGVQILMLIHIAQETGGCPPERLGSISYSLALFSQC